MPIMKIHLVIAIFTIISSLTVYSQKSKIDSLKKESFSTENDTGNGVKGNKKGDSWKMDKLDTEMRKLDQEMSHLNLEMKKIDFSKIQKQVDAEIQKIDRKKIEAQVNESLKSIDWNKINKQIDESIAQVQKVKLVEVKKEMEKVRAELAMQEANIKTTLRDIDVKKMKTDTENAFKEARQSMEKARQSMETAKENFKKLQGFTAALQNDGLIDKTKPYKVEVREGKLYINEKKQSKEVSEKYKHFYYKNNFTINKSNDNETLNDK